MAVTLDELDAWGTLDSAGLAAVASTMDGADSLAFQEASASVSCSATVNAPDFQKAKSMSATASVAATATADTGRTKGMISAFTSAAGSVTASAILIRLVNGQPTANVSATATITHKQSMKTVPIVNHTVTVVNSGGSNYFAIDGVTAPTLALVRGTIYIFDVSDSSNSGHPFAFRTTADLGYDTGLSRSGTAGSSGAYVQLILASDAPASLKYYCTIHGNGMGNSVTTTASTTAAPVVTATTNEPDPNFVVNVDATAMVSATVSAERPIATLAFNGAAGIDTAATVVASGEILGEKWAVIPDTVGVWAIQ